MAGYPEPTIAAVALRKFADACAPVLQVILSPAKAFYRLAEGGSWLAPVVLASVSGLISHSPDPLQAIAICVLDWTGRTPNLTGFALVFLALLPVYYAGSAAMLALVGTVVSGRETGLTWRAAFRRCWSVLGWVNLPVLFAGVLAATLLARGSVFMTAMAAVPPGVMPGFSYVLPLAASLALVAWTVTLGLVAVRQIFAVGTAKALVIIAVFGLLAGGLVHTPVARWVADDVWDEFAVLGRGQSLVSVDFAAYRFSAGHLPSRGDLVAFSASGFDESPRFVLDTAFGATLGIGGTNACLGRVIGLPGDTVELREGRVYLNGSLLAETYLAGLPIASAYPPGLSVPAVPVGPGQVFVLPDDRGVLGSLPLDAGPIVPLTRVRGKVVVVRAGSGPKEVDAGEGYSETPSWEPRTVTVVAGPSQAGGAVLSPVWQTAFVGGAPYEQCRSDWYAFDPDSGAVLLKVRMESTWSPGWIALPSGRILALAEWVGDPRAVTWQEAGFVVVSLRNAGSTLLWAGRDTVISWGGEAGKGLMSRVEQERQKDRGELKAASLELSPRGDSLLIGDFYGHLESAVQGPAHYHLRCFDPSGLTGTFEPSGWPAWQVDWDRAQVFVAMSRGSGLDLVLLDLPDLGVNRQAQFPDDTAGPTATGWRSPVAAGFVDPSGRPAWWVESPGGIFLVSASLESARLFPALASLLWTTPEGWCLVTSGGATSLVEPSGKVAWSRKGAVASGACDHDGRLSVIVLGGVRRDAYSVEALDRSGRVVASQDLTGAGDLAPTVLVPADGCALVVYGRDEQADGGGGGVSALAIGYPAGLPGTPAEMTGLDLSGPEGPCLATVLGRGRFLVLVSPGAFPGAPAQLYFYDAGGPFGLSER